MLCNPAGKNRNTDIDVGLRALTTARKALGKPDAAFSRYEIAQVCGCSAHAIYFIEQKALEKVRRALARVGVLCVGDAL